MDAPDCSWRARATREGKRHCLERGLGYAGQRQSQPGNRGRVTRPLSRQRLLQLTAGGVGAMAVARGLAAADGAQAAWAAQRASTLKMWWWGQGGGRHPAVDDRHPEEVPAAARGQGLRDPDGHEQRDPAVHERRSGRASAGRSVPLQRDLPHGERLLGYVNELNSLLPAPVLKSSGATNSPCTRASCTGSAYSVGFGIAQQEPLPQGRPRSEQPPK